MEFSEIQSMSLEDGEKAGIEKTEQIEAKIAEIKAVIEALKAELLSAMDRRGR